MRVLQRSVVATVLFFSLNSFAASSLFNSDDFWPALGPSDYFSVQSSRTLLRWQPTFGLFNTYAWRPIQIVSTTGARVRGLIDDSLIHFISAGMGVTDRLQIGATLPIVSWNRFTDPAVVGATAANYFDVGDLRAGVKFRLVDGLAVEAFGTAPTGNQSHFMGESGFVGGGRIIADIHPTERLKFSFNAGATTQPAVLFRTKLDFKERFWGGIGASLALADGVDLLCEATTTTSLKHFFTDKINSPTEIDAGIKWRLSESGFTLSAGGGTCLICNAKAPTARAILGMEVRLGSRNLKKEISEPLASSQQFLEPIYFAFGRADISESAVPILGRIADQLRFSKKPLRVEVQGHADSIGSLKRNQQISLERADRVVRYLRLRGTPDTIDLKVVGVGAGQPIAPNNTPEGRAKNRCAVFLIQ